MTDRSKLSEKLIEDYREIFTFFDRDHNGYIDMDDLDAIFRSLGQNPTYREVRDVVNEIDDDDDQAISFPDFLNAMTCKVSPQAVVIEIDELFSIFDHNKDGIISREEVLDTFKRLGEDLREAVTMFNSADANHDGHIDPTEFQHFFFNR